MQGTQDEELAGTYRKLFDTIERGTEKCSKDRLQTLIEEKKEHLKLGLEAFDESTSQTRSKFSAGSSFTIDGKTIKLDEKEKELVLKLSNILHLNESQCASLWNTFRSLDGETINTAKEQNFPLVEHIPLILDFVSFYYEERISLLQCISSLKRITLDKLHPYFNIANDTIYKLFVENGSSERFFKQYATLVRTCPPKHLNQTSAQWPLVWAKQNLKEQKALLEIVFLCSLTHIPKPTTILSHIQELEASSFGSVVAFSYLLDEEATAIHREVINICIILSVNLILPPTLSIGVKLNPSEVDQSLLNTPDVIVKLNQIVAFMGDSEEHSLFLLAWSFFLSCVDTALNDDNLATPPTNYSQVIELLEGKQTIHHTLLLERPQVNGLQMQQTVNRNASIKQSPHLDRILIGRALKLNVFDMSTNILKSSICSEEDVNSCGYRGVVRVLLNSFLSITRPNYIPMESYASLINAYCLVYKNQPELCRLFWQTDLDKCNPASLLTTACGRFPVLFTDFIQLLSAVSGAPDNETEQSDAFSALEVFNYLCSIPSITVVLPSAVQTIAKEEDGEAVVYIQEPLQVTPEMSFMHGISIPEGSRGLLLSTSETERIVRFTATYSGWHLMASILGTFASGNANRFIEVEDESQTLQGRNSDAIKSILELVHNVLTSNPKLIPTLVNHINTAAGDVADDNSPPLLVSIICNIITFCSTMEPCPIDILTLGIQCLTLLLPTYKSHIWQYLKHTPILPTMNTSVQFSSGIIRPYSGSQIQQIVSKVEFTSGRYTLLLAFLDLVQGLVQDIQSSWWLAEVAQDANQQCQVEVLYVCLHYLMLDVFPSYVLWRYKKLSERFLIGIKLLTIFSEVAIHFKLPSTADAKLSLNSIREGIFNNFLYDGGIYHISPLIDTITEGAEMANVLYKSSHPKEAQRVEKLTEMTFCFVKVLLQHRLEQINQGSAVPESTLEHLLLEQSTGSRSTDFLLRIARHVYYRHSIALPTEATNVLTLLCRTTASWKIVPNFVQYLGSTEQVHSIIRTYLEIAKDHFQNENLSASIWQFMTTLMETQPSLAILFLDCGDFIMPSPKSAVRLLSGQVRSASSGPSPVVTESAIRAATDLLSHWETLSVEKPTVTSNVMRFLATFWQTAFDHYALVERSRADNALWDVVGKVLLNPTNSMDTLNLNTLDLLDPKAETIHFDMDVRRRCCLNLSKAYAMRIIAYEIHITVGNAHGQATTEKLPVGLKNLLSKISDPVKLAAMREAFVKSDFNPDLVLQAKSSVDTVLKTLHIQDRSILLCKMPRLGHGDDMACGKAHRYGDSYLYDYYLASTRIQSLYAQISEKHGHVEKTEDMLVDPIEAVSDIKEDASQCLRSLLLVNHNSSIVDSQVTLIRSFKTFIEICSRRSSDLIWSSRATTESADVLHSFLKELIKAARAETRDDGVTLTSYSVLVQFIRNLTEDWIGKNRSVVTGVDSNAKKNYFDKAFDLLSALSGLLNRENYALFQSICDNTAIRFHRPLLESILLCLRTLKGISDSLNSKHAQLQACLGDLLTVVCSSFHVLTIKASSYSAEGAQVTDNVQESCIKDVTVVVSLLIELISSKYKIPEAVWLDVFKKHQMFSNALNLFNTGIALVVNEVDRQCANVSNVYSISITPYAETALYFLLALSNIPKAAEQLVKENLFGSLCNNGLTPRLRCGALDLFIRFGDGNNPAFVERNPLHFNWCQMLGVINNLMRTLGRSELVLPNVVNFMQMYSPQIGKAYSNANGVNDSIFGLNPSISLASPLLEEIKYTSMIFFGLSKQLDKLSGLADNLFVSFKDCSLLLLQRYHYFLTHPSHMQAQLYPVDNIERQQAQTFDSVPQGDSKIRASSALMKSITKSALTIVHYNLSTLAVLTHAPLVLTTDDVEWPFGNTIINPDSRIVLGEAASFGTLIEYINVCLSMVSQGQDDKSVPTKELLDVVQDCALLLTTQLSLWIAKPNLTSNTRFDIAQQNVIDIAEILNKASTSLTKLETSQKTGYVKLQLGLIRSLQCFLAKRFFEK
ncbi:nucleoporin subcomplex protein binding to Pom34-domain-containing protein [Blakeslea trispora]|nr:nucleoporin subcomplex protein binding to Pom34-domain-containing protein [Blakeslea trispora]